MRSIPSHKGTSQRHLALNPGMMKRGHMQKKKKNAAGKEKLRRASKASREV